MSWCYWIGKEWNKYWIIEIYYKKRKRYRLKKIYAFSDFFCTWNSKQEVINKLKKIVKENGTLKTSTWSHSVEAVKMMINDSYSRKRDIIDVEKY